jgi:hypothetical protein
MMEYRYLATSVEGFVQQLACNLLPHGYWFYVQGKIPQGKDAALVDEKLLQRYDVGISRQARARRKQAGLANIHYLRYGPHWVLLATHGEHHFFAEEHSNLRDVRKAPIHFAGYSLTVRQGGFLLKRSADEPRTPDGKRRVRVQIGREAYRDLRASFLELAPRRSAEQLARELYRLPFEPYAPVRRQLLKILRLVNQKRRAAGLDEISNEVLRYRRRIVRPFDQVAQEDALAA